MRHLSKSLKNPTDHKLAYATKKVKLVKKYQNHEVHNLHVLAEAFPHLSATVPLVITQSDV